LSVAFTDTRFFFFLLADESIARKAGISVLDYYGNEETTSSWKMEFAGLSFSQTLF